MNANSFLTCLSSTGFNTGNSVAGLYTFTGFSGALCYNQLYAASYNSVSGFPFAPAFPMVYCGAGNQTTGWFSSSQFYQIGNGYTGDFGALLSLNYSGCQNTGNTNLLILSTIANVSGGNSGVYLGVTPSSRLFVSVSGYSSTITNEIEPNDSIFFSVEKNRYVNFGIFSIKRNSFYRKSYDFGSSSLAVQNLYLGGALTYPANTTGYSGSINEVYFFSGGLSDSAIGACVDCSFATGYSYSGTSTTFTNVEITGSYWTGIQQSQTTGYSVVSGSFVKADGSSGTLYYNSGITGNVQIYESLVPLTGTTPYTLTTSGLTLLFDTGRRASYTASSFFIYLGLSSGDNVEVYTYPKFNSGVSLSVVNNNYPAASGMVQLYGNGLAETNGVDYSVAFNNQLVGFFPTDILQYDVYPQIYTMPYATGYIQTGVSSASYTLITGISGVNITSSFNYDVYLNGQKMISGLNFSYSAPNLTVSGNDLLDINDPSGDILEFKLIANSGYLRGFQQITSPQFYISGITGYSEQIWVNGIRLANSVDYLKQDSCRAYTGEYVEPNYPFVLISTQNV